MHASDATDITWGIKCCDSCIEDVDFTIDDRVHGFHHISRWYHQIRVKLIKEESLNEDWEFGLFEETWSLIESPSFFLERHPI